MKLEGHIYCEGPDCEHHAHVGSDTMELGRLPVGFAKLIWYGGNGTDGEHGFCGTDCAMKWCARIEPPTVLGEEGETDG